MRKVTVSRMRERYAQTVLTFRITYVKAFLTDKYALVDYITLGAVPTFCRVSVKDLFIL